ncbi:MULTISPECIES: helix-turn-helix transcriptional regulator [unclassified Nocardioides]|uniref:helix-turn-helix transcriptional regulator n=1 Tax=unclassified Nocardioides TaxID=2615069 RepID=UPI0036118F5C
MARSARSEMLSLVAASTACVLVAVGLTRGVWWSNIHNGILGVTLSLVGAWLAAERPRSRESSLFLAAGLVEAVMFTGRQVGHTATGTAASWLGWLGVWPIVVGMLMTTLAVVCFPDGHLPSRQWRPAVLVGCVIAAVCATLSALWPVEWESAGLTIAPPFSLPGFATADAVWQVLAHPFYVVLQLSWVVAVAVRWRAGRSRAPLLGLLLGVGAAFVVLVIGQVVVGSTKPGLVMVSLVPLVAGWSALHGHLLTRYRALSWLTAAGQEQVGLPTALARTAAEALDAPGATVWMGDEAALHVVGVWPDTDVDSAPSSLDDLPERSWPVRSGGEVVGALVVPGITTMTRSEERMMQDLIAHAGLVLDRLTLAAVVQRERSAGHLGHLTPRELEVLELMAHGLTNAAICQELHLSVKTVEPLISTVFGKLGLHADPTVNRRVLAALEYHRG